MHKQGTVKRITKQARRPLDLSRPLLRGLNPEGRQGDLYTPLLVCWDLTLTGNLQYKYLSELLNKNKNRFLWSIRVASSRNLDLEIKETGCLIVGLFVIFPYSQLQQRATHSFIGLLKSATNEIARTIGANRHDTTAVAAIRLP